jgi:hypothetical protein
MTAGSSEKRPYPPPVLTSADTSASSSAAEALALMISRRTVHALEGGYAKTVVIH